MTAVQTVLRADYVESRETSTALCVTTSIVFSPQTYLSGIDSASWAYWNNLYIADRGPVTFEMNISLDDELLACCCSHSLADTLQTSILQWQVWKNSNISVQSQPQFSSSGTDQSFTLIFTIKLNQHIFHSDTEQTCPQHTPHVIVEPPAHVVNSHLQRVVLQMEYITLPDAANSATAVTDSVFHSSTSTTAEAQVEAIFGMNNNVWHGEFPQSIAYTSSPVCSSDDSVSQSVGAYYPTTHESLSADADNAVYFLNEQLNGMALYAISRIFGLEREKHLDRDEKNLQPAALMDIAPSVFLHGYAEALAGHWKHTKSVANSLYEITSRAQTEPLRQAQQLLHSLHRDERSIMHMSTDTIMQNHNLLEHHLWTSLQRQLMARFGLESTNSSGSFAYSAPISSSRTSQSDSVNLAQERNYMDARDLVNSTLSGDHDIEDLIDSGYCQEYKELECIASRSIS